MKSVFVSLLLVAGVATAQQTTPAPAQPVAPAPAPQKPAQPAPAPVVPAAAAKLTCVVPVQAGAASVNLEVALSADESIDFVTLTLTGPGVNETLFTQLDKGTFQQGLTQGALSMLVIQEGFSQDAGVLKKAGILSLNKTQDGSFGGVMAALGNVYPLSCK